MKTLKFIGLGLVIWGSSLIWPEINRWLSPSLQFGLLLGLSSLALLYIGWKKYHNIHFTRPRHPHRRQPGDIPGLPGWSNF